MLVNRISDEELALFYDFKPGSSITADTETLISLIREVTASRKVLRMIRDTLPHIGGREQSVFHMVKDINDLFKE